MGKKKEEEEEEQKSQYKMKGPKHTLYRIKHKK
jgi:hypothetical protein